MKEIQPVTMWNGIKGIYLTAYAGNVTLNTSAVFNYNILDANQQGLVSGNLIMTGEAYQQWTVDSEAWSWIADQLNLTIIGDYVPPVPEPIVPEVVAEVTE